MVFATRYLNKQWLIMSFYAFKYTKQNSNKISAYNFNRAFCLFLKISVEFKYNDSIHDKQSLLSIKTQWFFFIQVDNAYLDFSEWKVTFVLSLLDGFSQKCHDLGLLVKQTYKRINEYVITSYIMQHWRDQNDGENIHLCTLDIFMKT